VPTIYTRLLDAPIEQAREMGRFMRLFVSGSAPLPAQAFEDFRRLFGHVILERYGMTETLMNTSNPYYGERRPGTVGLPLPGVSLRLLDREGKPNGSSSKMIVTQARMVWFYSRPSQYQPTRNSEKWKDEVTNAVAHAARTIDGT
jgi:malonyl-CoA/methylmalonyl-CoA synthetase